MGTNYGHRIVTDGLVLHLDAGNIKSYPGTGTTWTDLSGYGSNGTLTTGPTFDSANGGSIAFDNTPYMHVTCGKVDSLIGLTNKVTVAAWVKRNTDNGGLIAGTWWGEKYALWCNGSGHPMVYTRGSAGSFQRAAAGYISDTIMTNIVMTFNRPIFNLYINSQLDSQFPYTWDYDFIWSSGTFAFTIGGINYSDTQTIFNGNLSIVQVYNRDLIQAEITQNYNALKGRFGL